LQALTQEQEKEFSAYFASLGEPERRRLEAQIDPQWSEFVEVPAPPQTLIDSPEYLNLKWNEKTQQGLYPAHREDILKIFNEDKIDEAAFIEAIGDGKSTKAGCITAMLVYYVECLKDPQKSLGVMKDQSIAFMNMATSAPQAKDIVFGKIKGIVNNSPWFKTFCPYDPKIKSRLRFPKDINIIPGSSSANFPLGYDILCFIMDEAAYLRQPGINTSRNVNDQAEEIYTAGQRRIKSRFISLKQKEFYKKLKIMISNPRLTGDFIERKYAQSKHANNIFAVRRALWEGKPKGTFGGKTFWDSVIKMHVPVELKTDWDANEHRARRDFAARPSNAITPYMDVEPLKTIMAQSKLQHPVKQYDQDGYPLTFHAWFKPMHGTLHAIHVDLSVSRHGCGFAMAYWDKVQRKAIVPYYERFAPTPQKHLNYEKVRSIIFELRRLGFKIYMVSYDNFQSEDSLQALKAKKIECKKLSIVSTLGPADNFVALMNQGQLDIYDQTWEYGDGNQITLVDECQALELLDGKKVEPPVNGSDDIFHGVAGALFWVGEMRSLTRNPQTSVIINKPVSAIINRRQGYFR
jgi:hypothetical protein